MKIYTIACIPGNGIGKKAIPAGQAGQAVLEAMAASQSEFRFEFTSFGWSCVILLEHLGETQAARVLTEIIEQVTADPALHTGDLGGKGTMVQVTEAVCRRVQASMTKPA